MIEPEKKVETMSLGLLKKCFDTAEHELFTVENLRYFLAILDGVMTKVSAIIVGGACVGGGV